MRSISIHKAFDLPPAAKAAVKQLLGRTLAADEQIGIIASPSVPESRDEVARKLSSFLDRRAEEVRDVPEEEINAACDYVRHRAA